MGTTFGDLIHMPVLNTLVGIPKVDSREEHQELLRRYEVSIFISIRSGDSSLFETLLPEAESITVPPEAFEEFLFTITEEIQVSRARILLHRFLDDKRETIGLLAHVGDTRSDEYRNRVQIRNNH